MRFGLICVAMALGCNPIVSLGDEYCFDESCQSTSAGNGGDGGQSGTPGFRDVVLADQPIAYYRLDEPAMSTRVASEVGDHGGSTRFEVANDITFGVQGALADDPSPAIHLGGRGTLALDAPVDFVGTAPHTIELFLRTSITSGLYLHPLVNVNADVGWSLKLDQSSLSYFRIGPGGPEVRSTPWLTSDAWQHVVIVFDGGGVTFYDRGQPTSAAQSMTMSLSTYQATLAVRQADQPNPPDAPSAVDELVFYDRALTWQEICNHYRCARDRAACANPANTCDGS